MTTFKSLASGLVIAAGLAAFVPAADAEPIMCPMIYMPVCAVARHHAPKTYANACLARVAHARILHRGRCRMHRR